MDVGRRSRYLRCVMSVVECYMADETRAAFQGLHRCSEGAENRREGIRPRSGVGRARNGAAAGALRQEFGGGRGLIWCVPNNSY